MSVLKLLNVKLRLAKGMEDPELEKCFKHLDIVVLTRSVTKENKAVLTLVPMPGEINRFLLVSNIEIAGIATGYHYSIASQRAVEFSFENNVFTLPFGVAKKIIYKVKRKKGLNCDVPHNLLYTVWSVCPKESSSY